MSINSVSNDLASTVNFINAQKPIPPTVSGYSVAGKDDLALDPAGGQTVQINGTGFLPGATITFDGSAVAVVTFVNANQLTFTSPAKSAGTYTIYVVNADGGTAIYIPGVIYSLLPTWTTAAGSLGSYYETQSIANTVVASGDAPITYSLFSGSLPTGATLASNGTITGTAPVDNSSTTYSFTIQATDAQLQDSTRSFSLTINVDAVTWVSPANNTTYTSTANSAIANVTLSATDAAGYSVSYSANALPTGLSLSGANISGTPTVVADSSTLLTATAATTNRTAVRTINWSITVANDTYWKYNTLLIPGASTTFVDDASTNNFAVTINGDTKPNSLNPYSPGYYSNYFNGTPDTISLAANNALLGAGNYTVEFWVNVPTAPTGGAYYTCFAYGASGSVLRCFVLDSSGTKLGIWIGTGNVLMYATTAMVGQWAHIAIVRSGSTGTAYINGVSVGTFTDSTNFNTGQLYIASQAATNYLTGYISNFRVVVGSAVYTTAFTPPTSPLTAISGTSLLTCQSNRFIDNSTNNFTVTVAGTSSIKSFQPFTPNTSYSTYGSGYFDGSGDYLNLNGQSAFAFGSSASFTIQFWFYATAISADVVFYDGRPTTTQGLYPTIYLNGTTKVVSYVTNSTEVITGTTTIVVNQWYYVTLSRNSGSTRLFVNGVQQGSTYADTINYANPASRPTIMQSGYASNGYLTGYVTDFQVLNGTGYSSVTVPTTPQTAIANTSLLILQNNQSVNNNVFLDNSSNNFLITRNGNTAPGTFSPYGGNWSNYFASGAYIRTGSSSNLALGAGSWTCESWVYPTSFTTTAGPLWDFRNVGGYVSTAPLISFNTSGTVQYQSTLTSSNAVSLNTWSHIAIVRNGTTVTIYINGVANGTVTDSTTMTNTYCCIGAVNDAPASYYLTSYVSNARLVVGTAVYTTAFTPPTTPLTAISGTKFLSCQSNRFIDNSTNAFALSTTGSPTVQRFSPFNPSSVTPTSYSGYFDGSGDYLTTPASVNMNIGTGNFTFETWVFPTINSAGQALISIANTNAFYLNISGIPYYTIYFVGDYALGSTAVALNTWSHLAFVRSGTTITCYINGTSVGSITNSASVGTSVDTNYIGSHRGGNYWNGYLSNTRVVKGIAVYTGTFTVPTSPLQATQSSGTNIAAITGTETSLLTLQSTTFIDNSTNNFTISAFGNSQPTIQNPFGYTSATTNGYTVSTIGGSGYFDGTGDYLTATQNTAFNLGTGAFTVEAWINLSTLPSPSNGGIITLGNGASGSGPNYCGWGLWVMTNGTINFERYDGTEVTRQTSTTITLNQWNHIVAVRDSSSNFAIYINGVRGYSAASATTSYNNVNSDLLYIGRTISGGGPTTNYLPGFIGDVRVVNGTALYTSNFVPPSAPLTAVQNTVLLNNMTSAGIYDAAMMNNLETVGDAKLSTAVSKFGGSSMYFDGSGDYLTSPNRTNFNVGSGDFTVEAWVYTGSTSQQVIMGANRNVDGVGAWMLNLNYTGKVRFFCSYSGGTILDYNVGSGTISDSAWHHIAVTRSGSSVRIFIDGTQTGTTNTTLGTASIDNAIVDYRVGSTTDNALNFNGYIDDLRVTKGYARYTSNFTAPTSAFPIY